MRATRSRMKSAGARTSLIASSWHEPHPGLGPRFPSLRTCLPLSYSMIVLCGEAQFPPRQSTECAATAGSEPGSVRPGLLVPGPIERLHSPADREELALRVRLAGDAVAQLVEEGTLEILGEEHAGVAQRERGPLRQLARQLPGAIEEPFLGKHLVDRSPFERLLRGQLLPREEHVPRPVPPDDRGPDHVLTVARHHSAWEVREILEVGVL